jgi:integrase
MRGNITRRGKASWRLKLDLDRDATGKRRITYRTVRGTRAQAQAELARLLVAQDEGTLVEPSQASVAEYMHSWIETAANRGDVSPKTAERYRQLIERQIVPHLGAMPLQKLKPVHITNWHGTLLTSGGHDGGPLSARTVGHAHRVLHKALADAVRLELLLRNAASAAPPPKIEETEVQILTADQVQAVLNALRTTSIHPQIVVLLTTGVRRGELAGLQWADIDFEAGKLSIKRAVEKTKAGLRIKRPKTKHGTRTISLSARALAVLKQHRNDQHELRLKLGLGKLPADAFVFGDVNGALRDPDRITQDWKRFTAARGLPRVRLHSLRHSHASALIRSRTDPITVSRRLGHAKATTTLTLYGHMFDHSDEAAAEAIDAALKIGD